ncbi:hypothetical protein ACHAQA_004909 [Verticillium albo-atrum]
MAVTEFAVLPLKTKDELSPELLALLEKCQSIQDAWVLQDDPSLPVDRTARGTSMYRQLEDPTALLLTAQWASPAAHGRWIASPDNASIMTELGPHLDLEGEKAVVFFHLDAAVMTGWGPGERSVLEAPVLSVGRYGVAADGRAAFQETFDGAKGVVEEASRPFPLRGGWRIEKEEEGKEEFVMYGGWASVDEHMASVQHPRQAEFQALQKLVSTVDIRHYARII